MIGFCNGVPILARNVSNYANISLHLKRLLIQHRTLHTGLQTTRSTQRSHAPRDYKTTYSTTHVSSPPPGTEPCMYCGKMHPPGCALRSHPDANTSEKILWKESVMGKNIIWLNGPGATLNIQQRYDDASDRMVPVDDETLQMLRNNLPQGKKFDQNKMR